MARTFAVLVLTLAARAAYAQDAGTSWVTVGSMTTGREFHTATQLPSGAVLVAGGLQSDAGVLLSAEVYDPTTATWGVTAPMATGRAFHTATLLPSGDVLIVGGEDATGFDLASAELYDPVSATWSQTGALGTPRAGHTATLLPSGVVLVAGGGQIYDETGTESAESYDPTSGTWSPTGSMGTARLFAGSALLPDGRVLVVGGAFVYPPVFIDPMSGIPTANSELYDSSSGSWSDAGYLTAADLDSTVTLLLDGTALVAGGWTLRIPNPTPQNAALYDPSAGSWSATGDAGTGGWFSTLTALSSGRALMAGGAILTGGSGGYSTQAAAELYDPDAGCWVLTAPMSTRRMQHTATLLADGTVLVVGGTQFDDFLSLASAEVYTEPSLLGACLTAVDAGVPDAGNADAGVDAGTTRADAGASDAGLESTSPPTQGGGCNAFPGDLVPLLGFAVLLSLRRKRRGILEAGSHSSSPSKKPSRA